MTGETTKDSISFDDLAQFTREEAAGGNCSLGVLRLISGIASELERDKSKAMALYESGTVVNGAGPSTAFVATVSSGRTLEATTSLTDDNKPRQDIYYVRESLDGKREGYKLLTLYEEPQETSDVMCSRAIFWPAIDMADWDYSMVVSTQDEQAKFSSVDVDNALTRGDVVNSLLDSVKTKQLTSELAELLRLEALEKHHLPIDSRGATFTLSGENKPQELSRVIKDNLEFLGAAGLGTEALAEFTIKSDIRGKADQLLLTPVPEAGLYRADLLFHGLGHGVRQKTIGRLCVPDVVEKPVMLADISDAPIHDLPVSLEQAFDVPEIVHASDELVKEIDARLHQYRSYPVSEREQYKLVLYRDIEALIDLYRRSEYLGDEAVIDIGTLDIRSLEAGEHFCNTFCFKRVKVRLLANSDQDVLNSPDFLINLYGCTVEGAQSAFGGHIDGRRLSAVNCTVAYNDYDSKRLPRSRFADCLALDCGKAFVFPKSVQGCIAENCDSAFMECAGVNDSIAKHCEDAFVIMKYKMSDINPAEFTGNTAEFCENAFNYNAAMYYDHHTDARRKVSFKNNTVLNPSNWNGKYFVKLNESGNRAKLKVHPYKSRGNKIVRTFGGKRATKAYRTARQITQ